MEFFCQADVRTSEAELRELLTLERLPELCEAIDDMEEQDEELGRPIYFCHWGRYHLVRTLASGGVRFSVPDCPNALAWTVTTGFPPAPGAVVLHATIARTEQDEEFVRCTRDLIQTLARGIETHFGVVVPGTGDAAQACEVSEGFGGGGGGGGGGFELPDFRK